MRPLASNRMKDNLQNKETNRNRKIQVDIEVFHIKLKKIESMINKIQSYYQ